MIYIDTGAFIARYIEKDQYHKEAVGYWRKLKKQTQKIFTSNFIIDETITLLGRRAGNKFAAERGRNIIFSNTIEILRPQKDDELKALDIFEKYKDQKISYTDCISFTLMQKKKVKFAFTFDKHFELAGFRIFPQ